MQKRNAEVSLSYNVIVVTLEEHNVLLLVHNHNLKIEVDLVNSTDMNG